MGPKPTFPFRESHEIKKFVLNNPALVTPCMFLLSSQQYGSFFPFISLRRI